MSLLSTIICMILFIYVGVALGLTLVLIFGNYKISATLKKDNIKRELTGIKKFIVCFMVSLIWLYILRKSD